VADPTLSGHRLDSWKAIADYLHRDVGTARRWEKLGLPVRRVPGGRGRSVFAYTSEIDDWLTSKPSDPPETAPEVPPLRRRPAPTAIAAGLAAAAVIVAGAILWSSRAPQTVPGDLRIDVLPGAVVARDAAGHTAWRHEFPDTHVATPSNVGGQARVILQPVPAVYAATSYRLRRADDGIESGELMRFSGDGRLERRFTFDDMVGVRDRMYGPPWAITTFAAGGPDGEARVALAAHHYVWDPSLVTVLDDAFQRHGTFVHEGWIETLAWTTPTRLLIGGFSHPRDGGMVALIDTADLARGVPPGGPSYFKDCGCGPIAPEILVAMPRSEVNRASGSRFNRAIVQVTTDRVIARTIEVPDTDPPAEAIFEFDTSLMLLNASFSESYRTAHRQLEAKGVLQHPVEQCPDAKGPREIHVWRADTGWRVQTVR